MYLLWVLGVEFNLVTLNSANSFVVAPRFSETSCTPLPSSSLFLCLKHCIGRGAWSVSVECVWDAIDLRPAVWTLPDRRNRALCKLCCASLCRMRNAHVMHL